MKFLIKGVWIAGIVGLVGCSKEQPPENPPAPASAPESAILQPQIDTLHKAEDLSQQATEAAIEQHKQIEAATQ